VFRPLILTAEARRTRRAFIWLLVRVACFDVADQVLLPGEPPGASLLGADVLPDIRVRFDMTPQIDGGGESIGADAAFMLGERLPSASACAPNTLARDPRPEFRVGRCTRDGATIRLRGL
jgi:hypothetical protein